MRILVLGGTAWLGHLVAATALRDGHEVTCVARGSEVPPGARLVHADRDEDDALAEVAGSRWDVVIDVARHPGHVRRAVRDLEPVADRYVLVSTLNVYASHEAVGADETAALLPPLQADRMAEMLDYGPAKVACEQAVLDGFGPDRSVLARAGLIGGPGDPTGRTDYWPWRFAHPAAPGKVLVPAAPDMVTSVIDVRDLAAWLVRCGEQSLSGAIDVMGPSLSFREHLEAARQAAGSDAVAVAATESWLKDHDVNQWAGPRSMPLWLADPVWRGLNSRSTARARAAGLTHRPPVETLRDGMRWRAEHAEDADDRAGLSDADERELLDLLGEDAAPL